MRYQPTYLLGFLVAFALVVALLWPVERSKKERATGTALLELHRMFKTNGMPNPQVWPTAVKTLQINTLSFDDCNVIAIRKQGLGPISWSAGYRLSRKNARDMRWGLRQIHSVQVPFVPELAWSSSRMALTDEP